MIKYSSFEFLSSSIVFIILIYAFTKYYFFNYWKRHGIPHDIITIPLGSIPFKYFCGQISFGNVFKESYEKFKQHRFYGFYVFNRPLLIINDPELIQTILIKEFNRFSYRGWLVHEEVDPMSHNMFLVREDKWKRLRTKFSPIFTPAKLKKMYPLMTEVSNELFNFCDKELKDTDIFELKDIMCRFTIDIISSMVFGFNCNSLKDPNTEFRRIGVNSFMHSPLSMMLAIFLPEILEKITLPFNHEVVKQFFKNTFEKTMDYRRREKVDRKDFISLLMQLIDIGEIQNDEKKINKDQNIEVSDRLSIMDAAAQTYLFFVAGFETSASTATYCFLELARNPKIQEKLQEEIDKVAESSSGFTFDTVMEMEYLDMVVAETLRKYPPLSILNRVCTKNFVVPGTNYTIPEGMRILISPPGIHHDEKYFPNHDKFDPYRFTKENLEKRPAYVHLGFGEGPRNCIGKRMGLIQTKQAIVTILYNYNLTFCNKTEYPVRYAYNTFMQMPAGGIYLKLKKRRNSD